MVFNSKFKLSILVFFVFILISSIVTNAETTSIKQTKKPNSYIVELEGKSLVELKETKIRGRNLIKESEKDKDRIIKELKKNKIKIKNSFKNSINAVVVEASEKQLKTIKKIKGVKRVTPNYKVKALLQDSVPLIGADKAWELDQYGNKCIESNNECLTGKNIKIGVIDTGVNYLHPDLGGCFGYGCKVAGGYDFINFDDDPMDDNGHGTHVSSTAAGNGVLNGVAPDAEIYAFKVLDAYGYGDYESIISAIEMSVDPNQDGDFSDKLDVISLSLGGPGDENDIMSLAIDNVVKAGVTAVVAAGNEGSFMQSISSPGAARYAITVGATDKNNILADFSSIGPTYAGIKPDILAPGVDICAAGFVQDEWTQGCLDNNHILLSGTSMATPHVAGAVALLKQKNRNLTPFEIKRILQETSKSLGYKNYQQGAGLINVEEALKLSYIPESKCRNNRNYC